MTRLILSLSLASLCWGHAISVSVSDGQLNGNQISLRLRIPRYEVEKLPVAEIGAAIQFVGARLLTNDCGPVGEDLSCQMVFEFAAPVGEAIEATVTLSRITVPNHVHIMRLTRMDVTRQGVFDRSFEHERIDFHQEVALEAWWRGLRQGFAQIAYQPLLVLLLLLVGWVAKPPAYLTAAAVAFFIVLPDKLYAPPDFFQVATGLALVYLAAERWLFPDAGGKWIVSAVIGAIQGAAIAVMARSAGGGAIALGAGNLAAQALLSLLAWRYLGKIVANLWLLVKRS